MNNCGWGGHYIQPVSASCCCVTHFPEHSGLKQHACLLCPSSRGQWDARLRLQCWCWPGLGVRQQARLGMGLLQSSLWLMKDLFPRSYRMRGPGFLLAVDSRLPSATLGLLQLGFLLCQPHRGVWTPSGLTWSHL